MALSREPAQPALVPGVARDRRRRARSAPPAAARGCSGGGRGATAISTASTLVVLGGAGRDLPARARQRGRCAHTFFDPQDMWQSFIGNPKKGYYSVGAAIWLNIRMFLVAEVLILVVALVIALVRQSTQPGAVPARVLGDWSTWTSSAAFRCCW